MKLKPVTPELGDKMKSYFVIIGNRDCYGANTMEVLSGQKEEDIISSASGLSMIAGGPRIVSLEGAKKVLHNSFGWYRIYDASCGNEVQDFLEMALAHEKEKVYDPAVLKEARDIMLGFKNKIKDEISNKHEILINYLSEMTDDSTKEKIIGILESTAWKQKIAIERKDRIIRKKRAKESVWKIKSTCGKESVCSNCGELSHRIIIDGAPSYIEISKEKAFEILSGYGMSPDSAAKRLSLEN